MTHYDNNRPMTVAEQARVSPTKSFRNPENVVSSNELSVTEKTDVLKQWESDAKALQRATDEGMSAGKPPRLDEVKRAQSLLTRLTSCRRADSRGSTMISGDAARQGVTGHNVRYVLAIGLVGIVIGFVIVAFLLKSSV